MREKEPKNIMWLITAFFNFITAFVHTIVGQNLLITPYVKLEFALRLKAILHGCWHMVTITLFLTAIIFLYIGIRPKKFDSVTISALLGFFYMAYALVFGVMSITYGIFLHQSLTLLLIGILALIGTKTTRHSRSTSK